MSDRRAAQNIAGAPKPPALARSGAPTILDILRVAGSPVSPPWPSAGTETAAAGMTLQEFAAWAGVNRSRLARHCVVIPPGPAPPLRPGQIPVRLIGNVRRIFREDLLGALVVCAPAGVMPDADRPAKADSGSARRASWDRSLDRLRHGRAAGE